MAKKQAVDVEPMKPGKTAKEQEENRKSWAEELRGSPVPMKKPELSKATVRTAKKPESQAEYQKRVMGIQHGMPAVKK